MGATRQDPDPTAVELADLDRILDLPVADFDREVDAHIAAFRAAGTGVVVPGTSSLGRVSRVHSGRQYEAEIARLPQMDRATEFRMAKRHEFLRRRAADALARAGLTAEEVEQVLRRPLGEVAELRGGDEPEVAYARRCLDELGRLRNLFLEQGLHLVLASAYRYRGLGVDLVDLIQEGNASLFQAIDGFDWRRDVRFRTYAQFWIHQAVLKALYNFSRTVRVPVWVQKALRKARRIQEQSPVPLSQEAVADKLGMPVERLEQLQSLRLGAVSLDAPVAGEDSPTMSEQIADVREPGRAPRDTVALGQRLAEVMQDLPPRERAILERRFGLSGQDVEILGDIGADLGISAERVRQLQNAALKRLQRPKARQRLADLV